MKRIQDLHMGKRKWQDCCSVVLLNGLIKKYCSTDITVIHIEIKGRICPQNSLRGSPLRQEAYNDMEEVRELMGRKAVSIRPITQTNWFLILQSSELQGRTLSDCIIFLIKQSFSLFMCVIYFIFYTYPIYLQDILTGYTYKIYL